MVYENLHKPSSDYLLPSCKMAFGNSKQSRRSSATKIFLLYSCHWLTSCIIPIKIINCYREVPRADRFMKIYINHPQATCFHPVKWRLEIPNRHGGVRRQRISSSFPPPLL